MNALRAYRRRIWVPAFGLGPLVLTDDAASAAAGEGGAR